MTEISGENDGGEPGSGGTSGPEDPGSGAVDTGLVREAVELKEAAEARAQAAVALRQDIAMLGEAIRSLREEASRLAEEARAGQPEVAAGAEEEGEPAPDADEQPQGRRRWRRRG